MKTKVSHSAIVELMYEAISNEKSLPSMTNATADAIKLSPVVDTAVAGLAMDPVDMQPKNKSDAMWLIRQSMDDITDDQVEELYQQFVASIEKIKNNPVQIERKTLYKKKNTVSETKTSSQMSKMKINEDSLEQELNSDDLDDAEMLQRLKKLLELPVGSEVVIANKKWDRVNHGTWRSQFVDGSDTPDKWTKDELIDLFTDVSDTDDDFESDEDDGDKILWGMNKKKPAEEPVSDESTFAQIAAELGLTTFGALKAVEVALKKMKFLLELPKDEREELILEALSDYIEFLQSSEELSDEDVAFLKDHPEELSGSDEFRDYLKKYINRELRNNGSDEEDSE